MLIKVTDLQKKYDFRPTGVLHVGASTGQELDAYIGMGIKRIVMVEAIPEVFAQLVDNAAKYAGRASITCINACLSDTDGEVVDFHISDNEGQSSSMLRPKEHLVQHPTVHFPEVMKAVTETVPTMFQKHDIDPTGLDFLNMDIQGAELRVLKGMGPLIKNFKWIYLETNYIELYEGCGLAIEVDNHLVKYGFSGVEEKRTGHGWGDKFYCLGV